MASAGDARLLKSTKFPPEFSQKVDMQKVNLQVIKKWIANRISEILGNEDDVVIELCFNLIDGPRYPDIKSLQIQLTGFLDKDTAPFCKELWKLLLSAQGNPQGVPKELLEAKKLELMQEKLEADRAAEDARKRRDDFDRRDREVSELKERERRDRASDRGDRFGRRGDRAPEGRGRGGHGWGGNRSRETAMSPGLEAAGVAIVAGSGDGAAHRPGQRQTDPALEAAVRPAAIGAPEALHAARDSLPDTEIRGRDLGLLVVMLTDRGGNHATEGTAEMPDADDHNPRNAFLLHQNEDGNPFLGVGQGSGEDVIQLRHRPVRGAPRDLAAEAPAAAVIDPLIALDHAHPRNADTVANGVMVATMKTMKPSRRAMILTGRDAIAPLRLRLHQTVADRLIFWKMNRVLRALSCAACLSSTKRCGKPLA
ncbi:Serine/arginine repetitive matrix protein 1 [Trichoderma ghanense]|uniref:Serine/arginine repetitive matrix protein 1 n=1 Tax=Trichoderma ghanense TaxID=65468 RepID=A0ABY2GTF5_9HYPO